ncbi:unnamed protein product [Heterotrigona itama]|uniref:Uncharacterized protein n=1 Tax=Heterotrigona itama TaxID=395501 RepID=A0A6V7H1Q1_9HYME|nr:unnamed protein product [Heterotrigona itama]
MKITLYVLAAFVCVQVATAASKSKGAAEKAIEVSAEASAEAKASAELSAEKSGELSASSKKKGKSGSLSAEKSGSVSAEKTTSGKLSLEKDKSEEGCANLEWKEILDEITAILRCLKEGKDLKSSLKLKEGGQISILEKLKKKIALTLESIEKGKPADDLLKEEDIKTLKEIQEKLVVIAQLVQKGKDISGLLNAEATVKIIAELKASIKTLLNANLAAEESKKLKGGLLGLLQGKGLLDLDLIKSVTPIIAELQKKGIDLGALKKWTNIGAGAIDITSIQKTVEKVTAALNGGTDIQNILSSAGAEKFGISASELKGLQGVLGLVGKLAAEGALNLKSLLNLQGGASIINIRKLLPLPLP